MKRRWRRVPWSITLSACLLAAADAWLFAPGRTPHVAGEEGKIAVSRGTDAGPGSLREALFRAAASPERAEVVVRTPRIRLRTPLPPLANPRGTVLRCELSRCSIDASNFSGSPAIDVGAPNTRIHGIEIVGVRGTAVLVRSPGVTLHGMGFRRNEVGVQIAASSVVVSESTFSENGVGVRIDGAADRVVLRADVFRDHRTAGVWAVAPTQSAGAPGDALVAFDNRFERDWIGAVVIHLPSWIESNEIIGSRETGIYLGGSRNAVLKNRFVGGEGIALQGEDLWSSTISMNELGNNGLIGLLLRRGGSNQVEENRVYGNGFGIATVSEARLEPTVLRGNVLFAQRHDAIWVFAGNPVIRDNRVVNNVGAGIRLLEPSAASDQAEQDRLLTTTNDLERNGLPLARELRSRSE